MIGHRSRAEGQAKEFLSSFFHCASKHGISGGFGESKYRHQLAQLTNRRIEFHAARLSEELQRMCGFCDVVEGP
jgi:hypothetical protein